MGAKRPKSLVKDKRVYYLDESSKASAVLDYNEGSPEYYYLYPGGPGKPDLHPPNRHLHLRSPRDAALWEGL